MNFEGRVFVRLADATTRSPLFDQPALEQILSTACDVQAQGPFNALFDHFDMGYALPQQGVIKGMWGGVGGVERVQARLLPANLGGTPPVRIDALWRAAIVARIAPATSRITDVETQRPDLEGIDDEIVAALGSLPANPVTLEQERRQRVLARIRATLEQPDAFTGDAFDRWLATVGAASTGDLLARFRTTAYSSAVRVAFAPPAPLAPTPLHLPITAAVLVRDSANLAVSQLLAESKVLAERLQGAGIETPHDAALRPRHAVLVIWVVPATLFDDADWPGGDADNVANIALSTAAPLGAPFTVDDGRHVADLFAFKGNYQDPDDGNRAKTLTVPTVLSESLRLAFLQDPRPSKVYGVLADTYTIGYRPSRAPTMSPLSAWPTKPMSTNWARSKSTPKIGRRKDKSGWASPWWTPPAPRV